MAKSDAFVRVAARIDHYQQEAVEIQKRLVAVPALGPESAGEGEKAKAEVVRELLRQMGINDVKEFNAPDKRVPSGYRPNLLVKIQGKNPSKTVWVMAHLDVVPPGDLKLWESDPFSLKVDGDKLIGRGVEDNHQGLVSALLAVKALKEEGVAPESTIGLAIVSDEETCSEYGLQYLMEHHSKEFGKDDLIIVPDAGDPSGQTIEVAEKSILWSKFHLQGKQCHASTPEQGINAHRAGAHLIVKLDTLHKRFSARDEVFDPPISTFEPTKKEANVPNINTIPGEDVFYLDCRILPKYSLEQVEGEIRKMADEVEKQFGVKVNISSAQSAEAAPPTPVDAPVVQALSRAIKAVKGVDSKTIGIGGGTVAAIFRRAGYPAAVWSTIEDTAHQPNEYSLISSTLSDAKVLAHMFLR
jgi:succinyl-diaminopimelate desuccinylase